MKQLAYTKRLLLPATYIIGFILGYYLGAYQFSLLRMAEEFSLSTTQYGILAGTTFGAQLIISLLYALLSIKLSKKLLLLIALFLQAAAFLLFSVVSSYTSLLVVVCLAGAGFGASESLYLSFVTDMHPQNITRHSNMANALFGLGAFISPLLSNFWSDHGGGWRQFFLPATALVAIVIVMYIFMRFPNQQKKSDSLSTVKKQGDFSLFRSPLLYLTIIWIMLYLGIEGSTSSYADLYLTSQLSAPADISAMSISLFWLMMVPSRFLMGLVKKNHIRIIALFAVILAFTSIGIALVSNINISIMLFAVSGFLCGPIWPTIFACGQRAFPAATGTLGSLCVAFSGLGGFLFPAILGAVSDGKSLSTVYFGIAVIALLLLIWTAVIKKSLQKHSVNLS